MIKISKMDQKNFLGYFKRFPTDDSLQQNKSMLLKVSSLNFSGINISPFEYHDGSTEKIHINSCFKRLLHNYQLENPKEYGSIAKLDLLFQKNRYTILYKNTVGVLRGKLLSRQQFETIWDLMFQQNQENIKCPSLKESDIEVLKSFDRMIYQAFLEHIYGEIDWCKIKEYNAEIYLLELHKWHSKCYLKLDRKSQLLKEYLMRKNLDVLFVQQADIESIRKILPDNYATSHSSKSMIIYKKDLFLGDPHLAVFEDKYGETLDFNKDSVFLKFKEYLLISAHLSSKKVKTEQLENMKRTLAVIAKEDSNLKIIVGVDANQFIKKVQSFNVFPYLEEDITTRKRRTDMQLQFEKAGVVVEDVKDHLVTNLKMMNMGVETVQCEHVNEEFLPNQHHPFDHFAVYSMIMDQICEMDHASIGVLGSDKRKDCKSVSTLDSNKKSTNTFKPQSRFQDRQQMMAPPLIVISPCQQLPQVQNIFNQLERSSRNSNYSKNSCTSKSPRARYVQTPCLNILKFRKSTFGTQQMKQEKQLQFQKPQKSIFKFREINRSKSVQKSNQKWMKQSAAKPTPVTLTTSAGTTIGYRKQQNIKSQTHLAPSIYNPYKYSTKYNR